MNNEQLDIVTRQDLKNILDDRFSIFEEKMDQKFIAAEKKTDEKFEEMARMVNRGFTSVTQGLYAILEHTRLINLKLNSITKNQQSFVSKTKHNSLEKRVTTLEQKIK